ncbi:MAG: DNA gyrase C-terminal beta-propeller domain-containing protein, partial [Patescibacteria group bacterium]
SGVKAANITPKTGEIVGGFVLTGSEMGDIICMSKHGQTIRMALKDIPERSRATQGVIVMRLEAGDKVASISLVMEAQGEHAAEVVEEALKKAQKEEAVLMKELAAEGSEEEHALLAEEPVRHAEPLDSARGKLRPPRHGEPRRTTKHPASKAAKETKKPKIKKKGKKKR